jgi:hypothetical protein
MSDNLSTLLASMDVDALRRALRQAQQAATSHSKADTPIAPPARAPTVELSTLRSQYRVRFKLLARSEGGRVVASRELELVNERVMGKICWPAAEALASFLLARHCAEPSKLDTALTKGAAAARSGRAFVELGAGCALPSLVAASTGAYSTVVATDMTADRVAIAARNAELNGLTLGAAPLDFDEATSLAEVVGAAEEGCVIAAAEVHYNPEALAQLIAAVGTYMRERVDRRPARTLGRPPPEDLPADELILARSAVFAHNDELMRSLAASAGLQPSGPPIHIRAGGLLHAASPTLYEPNPNDAVDLFRFHLAQAPSPSPNRNRTPPSAAAAQLPATSAPAAAATAAPPHATAAVKAGGTGNGATTASAPAAAATADHSPGMWQADAAPTRMDAPGPGAAAAGC